MSTFAKLKEQYNMFLAPAFKIEADGKALPSGELGIGGVGIDLGMGREVSACRFTASNLFKDGTRQVSQDALDCLQAGRKLKVSVGYGSSLTPVFFGYIANLNLKWAENMSLSVTGLDARSLMRENKTEISFAGKKITQVVKDILGAYSALLPSCEVKLDDLVESANLTKTTSDLDFICSEAEKRGADFLVDYDKAIIKELEPKACVTLDWEDYELSLDMGYLKTKYTMRGYDAEQQKKHEKSAEAAQPGNQTDVFTVKKELPVDLSVSAEAVQEILNGKIRTDVRSSLRGSVNLAGLPEIKPGSLVKLAGSPLGKLGLGDEALILSVRHSLGESGFQSGFTIGAKA